MRVLKIDECLNAGHSIEAESKMSSEIGRTTEKTTYTQAKRPPIRAAPRVPSNSTLGIFSYDSGLSLPSRGPEGGSLALWSSKVAKVGGAEGWRGRRRGKRVREVVWKKPRWMEVCG